MDILPIVSLTAVLIVKPICLGAVLAAPSSDNNRNPVPHTWPTALACRVILHLVPSQRDTPELYVHLGYYVDDGMCFHLAAWGLSHDETQRSLHVVAKGLERLNSEESCADQSRRATIDVDCVDTTPEWGIPIEGVEPRPLVNCAHAVVVHEYGAIRRSTHVAVGGQALEACCTRVEKAVGFGHEGSLGHGPEFTEILNQILVRLARLVERIWL